MHCVRGRVATHRSPYRRVSILSNARSPQPQRKQSARLAKHAHAVVDGRERIPSTSAAFERWMCLRTCAGSQTPTTTRLIQTALSVLEEGANNLGRALDRAYVSGAEVEELLNRLVLSLKHVLRRNVRG